ncbi:NAD-malate dehydrogenase [Mycena pura]|uniref:Malate dehydrogenase n=1 Tax=Mycena pura TaxID=153505 RepID=A0AAD6YLE1_9AGAR|nr:NAD-malate dehydrogenase [Mycena pura]
MVKAVVLGAAGGIGQPLSLLLKVNPQITELGLYDIVNTPGVAADLSHIATPAVVIGRLPPDDGMQAVLAGADLVVIPAGVPRKPGINGKIVMELATGIATVCPKAFVLVISNPVNSTVPIVAEVFKKHGVYNPKKLFGVTTLDVVRASTFVAEILQKPEEAPKVVVPVVGGHSGVTIVPLLSQSTHPLPGDLSGDAYAALVKRIQFGGDEVVKAKDGAGSATLSMAYAGAEFANKIIRAVKGERGIVAPSFVPLDADRDGATALGRAGVVDLEFFSSNVELGPEGVVKIHSLGRITSQEEELVKAAIPELRTNIKTGVDFVRAKYEAEEKNPRL